VPRYRQEVLNVLLAQLLGERGVAAVPETILTYGVNRQRGMPDVLVEFQGLRVAIEGEVEAATAQDKALESARDRVENAIAHIGVAVVYPGHLRQLVFATAKADLASSNLQIAIVTESGATGFVQGNVDYLERALRGAFEQLVREDVVVQAVQEIDAAVERFASAVTFTSGNVSRLADILGIRELDESPDLTRENEE
jgi:hypothetical protein